jgi:hypothetical protein
VGSVEGGLAGGHGQVQEEVVVAEQKVEDRRRRRSVDGPHQRRGDDAREEPGRRHIPVVALVSHLEGLGRDALEVDGPGLTEHAGERRAERGRHPPQALGNGRVVGPEPERAAEPLVEGRERAVAVRPVLYDHHRHRGRYDPRHGPDGAVLVARRERDCAGVDERTGGLAARRPAFEEDGADRRPSDGPAHSCPIDRRPRVQDRAVLERGNRLTSRPNVDEHGARLKDPGHCRLVGCPHERADGVVRIIFEPRDEEAQVMVAACRRPPGELRDGCAVRAGRLGERREPHVDRMDAAAKDFGRAHGRAPAVRAPAARAARMARRAARALLDARSTPAADNRAS